MPQQQMMQYVAWPGGQMAGQPMMMQPGAGMPQVMASMPAGAMQMVQGPGGMQMVPVQTAPGGPVQMIPMQTMPTQQVAPAQQTAPDAGDGGQE